MNQWHRRGRDEASDHVRTQPAAHCAAGFSLIELLVVIGIIGLLLGILLPVMEKVRHKGYIDACASNLRQIGQAMQMYANENRGALPRTVYLPGAVPAFGTGGAAANAFASGGPAPNDVTAALFLLMRTQKLPPSILICPYNDVFEYEAEKADPLARSNFTDYKKNLGYSIANPYPDDLAVAAGYKWTSKLGSSFPLASDINPGTDAPRDDVLTPQPNSAASILRKANSQNHEKEGQNVLFADGHVQYQITPFCGPNNENIYCNRNKQVLASPVDKDDAVLLPTDD